MTLLEMSGILQSLLLRLVEDEAGIEETQDFNTPIVNPVFYDNAAKGYANQLDASISSLRRHFLLVFDRGKRNQPAYTLYPWKLL